MKAWPLVGVVLGVLLGHGVVAQAESPAKLVRLGTLTAGTLATRADLWRAFREALRELGYVEGRNLVIEERSLERGSDRLDDLAAELVRLKVDVLVALGSEASQAAKRASRDVPIVMTGVADPELSGLVASLSRPGGNLTGVTLRSAEITAKRVELLKEMAPRISRVAVLGNSGLAVHDVMLQQAEAGARALGIQPIVLRIRQAADIEPAFKAAVDGRAEAMVVLDSPLTVTHRARIVALAAQRGLPAIYGLTPFADAGGLAVYGPNTREMMRRTAIYVDRILKGAKPGELPIEQPEKLELIINLRAAKALGLVVPKAVLFRADRVIE